MRIEAVDTTRSDGSSTKLVHMRMRRWVGKNSTKSRDLLILGLVISAIHLIQVWRLAWLNLTSNAENTHDNASRAKSFTNVRKSVSSNIVPANTFSQSDSGATAVATTIKEGAANGSDERYQVPSTTISRFEDLKILVFMTTSLSTNHVGFFPCWENATKSVGLLRQADLLLFTSENPGRKVLHYLRTSQSK